MVILLSGRRNRIEKEIIEILTNAGATYISDRAIFSGKNNITIVSEYQKTDIKVNKGVAIIIDDSGRFVGQLFSKEIIGICEDCNKQALSVFSKSPVAVITCGMGAKNTVTVSHKSEHSILISLQRTITDIYGATLEPAEFLIQLKNNYSEFSLMASIAVLLLYGIIPKEL